MRYPIFALVILALIMAACSRGPSAPVQPANADNGSDSPASNPDPQGQSVRPGSISLTGAGATFPFPLYSRWFYEYAFVDLEVRFNYQSIGSGGGIRQITARTVDFGGSDALLNDEHKANAPGLIQIPIVAGAVVPVYNVIDTDGNKIEAGVNFTPDLLVDIFLGKVNRWDDPRLFENNPDIKFPNQPIVVAHRSDGSGTTFLWVSFLSQVSDEWTNTVGVGTSVNWPVGLGGKGNEGVAGLVSEQPGSIGYVEVAYAKQNNLSFGFVQNREGNFIEPDLESIVAASDAFAGEMPQDFGQLLTNAPGADSYPVAGYTFILLYEDMPDCVKAKKLVDFIFWAMSEGDQFALELLYAPLGESVQKLVGDRLNSLTCEGGKSLAGN